MSVPTFQRLILRNQAGDAVSFVAGSDNTHDAFVGASGSVPFYVSAGAGQDVLIGVRGVADPFSVSHSSAGVTLGAGTNPLHLQGVADLDVSGTLSISGSNVASLITSAQTAADNANSSASQAYSLAQSADTTATNAATAAAAAQSTADSNGSAITALQTQAGDFESRIAALESQFVV
jgi:hypothetical protein